MFTVAKLAVSQQYQYVPFPDSGAIWSEHYSYGEPTWPDTVVKPDSYERFAENGEDTIIGGKVYKKLYMFLHDTVFNKENAVYVGGIREENKRIYFYADTPVHPYKPILDTVNHEEILLYDFNVNVGDTIWSGNFDNNWLVVSNIDTVQIGNSLRKRIHFQYLTTKWIEGIGSTNGLLFATMGEPTKEGVPTNNLICFKHSDDEEILFVYDHCFPDAINNVETVKNNTTIKIFPNPSSKNIMFSFKDLKIEKLEIRDCTGKVYDSYNVRGKHNFLLPVSNYKPGIYFYIATDMSGTGYTGKFVVR